MPESIENRIVLQARTWKDTPFHHQARLKGKGCDCLGLLVGVAGELQLTDANGRLLSDYDEPNYSRAPDGNYLIARLTGLLVEKDAPAPGQVGLFLIDDSPQHLAIFTDFEGGLGIIHCFAQARRVVEHRFDEDWQSRLLKVYQWPALS